MVYVHTRIISIYPLLFIVWPLCLWLLIEVLSRFKGRRLNLWTFLATFIIYLFITQMRVIENQEGIFFDLNAIINMPLLTNIVLVEAAILFVYKSLKTPSVKFRDAAPFIGFASVIPWLAPLIVESAVLARWFAEDRFYEMTEGKCIGGAGFSDILFHYGGRNFVISLTLFLTWIFLLRGTRRISQLWEERKDKEAMREEERQWRLRVWENPLTLLDDEERSVFLTSYGHLSREQQNEILRNKILPDKGIILINPKKGE